ncbi:hypothetical protein TNCT_11431 [Trichonephila clavata]|uniref:Uncharacterized protein n=1 Tax=Trichonephila clavata TaxID=2740835 RepID=A0A8X6FNW7_TRICU|nr:hypothetical protein TNCT_11431 [Trichonephila clavata]
MEERRRREKEWSIRGQKVSDYSYRYTKNEGLHVFHPKERKMQESRGLSKKNSSDQWGMKISSNDDLSEKRRKIATLEEETEMDKAEKEYSRGTCFKVKIRLGEKNLRKRGRQIVEEFLRTCNNEKSIQRCSRFERINKKNRKPLLFRQRRPERGF